MDAPRRLVIATGNPGKVREIAIALADSHVVPVTVGELVPDFDPVEDGATFLQNARIKAAAAVAATGLPACADDSGLCVVGLGLEPGIHSARYAGPDKSDGQRIDFLLEQMAALAGSARDAHFACAVCAYIPSGWLSEEGLASAEPSPWPGLVEVTTDGRLDGHIGLSVQGNGGFGYDPIFFPIHGDGRTLAQFPMEEKNRISHRGRALAALKTRLR